MYIFKRLEEGKWSRGRPVFKKVEGEPRVLFVKEGETTWSIRKSVTASEAHIKGGRATSSPTSPDAGPSDRDGVQRWRYRDGEWKEGVISITCV